MEVVCWPCLWCVCSAGKLQTCPATPGESPVFASSSFQNYGKVLSVVGPSVKGPQKQSSSSRAKGRVQAPTPGGGGRGKSKASSPPTQTQAQKKVCKRGQASYLPAAGLCV